MRPTERWAPVVGWEGLYEVSDQGSVRSLRAGRLLKHWYAHGYPHVTLCIHGKSYARAVHRLVLEAFVGPKPPGTEACHNDGVRSNPRVENLRWDTHLANLRDRRLHGNFKKACIHGHPFEGENVLIGKRGERICMECRRRRGRAQSERKKAERQARPPKEPRTHCRRGHSLEDAYHASDGRRLCRTCQLNSARESYLRRKAK